MMLSIHSIYEATIKFNTNYDHADNLIAVKVTSTLFFCSRFKSQFKDNFFMNRRVRRERRGELIAMSLD